MMKKVTLLLLSGSVIAGCSNEDPGPDQNPSPMQESALKQESVPEQKTVRGLLNHFPSDVRSAQAWHGHNFLVGDTPVIPTEAVSEETLKEFVGSKVVVTGVWHPGERWNPSEEEQNMPRPLDPPHPDQEEIVRGDGHKASSISRLEE